MAMEKITISRQEIAVYKALSSTAGWMTISAISKHIEDAAAPGSINRIMLKLVDLELVDLVKMHPAFHYRWSEKAAKQNAPYLQQLKKAAEVFGAGQ